jgi:hypothetical protein
MEIENGAGCERSQRGRREVGVVVVTLRNEKIFVKTIEWEDVR